MDNIDVLFLLGDIAVLNERAELIALYEGLTYERDAKKRAPFAKRLIDFTGRITDTISKKMG